MREYTIIIEGMHENTTYKIQAYSRKNALLKLLADYEIDFDANDVIVLK